MPSRNPGERRKQPRAAARLPVSLFDRSTGRTISTHLKTSNFSAGGLCLEGSASLILGETYRFALSMPDGGRVDGEMKVVWKQPNAYVSFYGARIDDIGFFGRNRLERVIGRELNIPTREGAYLKIAAAGIIVFFTLHYSEKIIQSLGLQMGLVCIALGTISAALFGAAAVWRR